MIYTKDFIKKVRDAYNDVVVLNLLAQQEDENSIKLLGKLLKEGSYETSLIITEKDIIYAYENNKMDELYKKAKEKALREEIYNEWFQIYSNYLSNERIHSKEKIDMVLGIIKKGSL